MQQNIEKTKKVKEKTHFKCEECKFYTFNKYDFNRHNNCKKHKDKISSKNKESMDKVENKIISCDKCKKIFNCRSTLYRHKKSNKCNITALENTNKETNEVNIFTPLKNSIRTADESSTVIPVTHLDGIISELIKQNNYLHLCTFKTPIIERKKINKG